MGNLASTYYNQERWNEAEQLQIQVMDMTKKLLGAEHPDTSRSMRHLADTYRVQGRWNEAEQLSSSSIHKRESDNKETVELSEHPSIVIKEALEPN
jgi:hypothetical protein